MPEADKSVPSKPLCAYCGGLGPLTKEHIFPKFLYRQVPTHKTGYNARANRFMTWEAQVRDVCEDCNNGPLSALDGYARRFLTALHCERTYAESQQLVITYDYLLLLRWLLKVSYNAARALSQTPHLLKEAVPFIRDGQTSPPAVAFLAVEVVRDAPLTADARGELPEEARGWSHIPAKMFRVGPGVLYEPRSPTPHAHHCMRFVAINSWYFTFCLVGASTDRPARRRLLSSHRGFVPDAVVLSRQQSTATLSVSRRTVIDLYAFQGMRVQDQWREYAKQAFPKRAI
jgi:hypothetical protein